MIDIEFIKVECHLLAGNEAPTALLVPKLLLERGALFLGQAVKMK
jgi:hypothetical protein